MEEIVGMLHEGGYSCVLRNGDIYTFTRRGVADLFDLLTRRPDLLRGADVADKVVGKGAAALMVLGGVSRLHADVLSEPAWHLLVQCGVDTTYGSLVSYIMNRAQTGWCPVESLCRDAATPADCLTLIEGFLKVNDVKTTID